MLLNKETEKLIEEIYADSKITPGEIIKLRESANEAEQKVLAELGYEGGIDALLKSFEVTNQLLQDTVLKLRRSDDITDMGRAVVYDAIGANIELLKATLKAFT